MLRLSPISHKTPERSSLLKLVSKERTLFICYICSITQLIFANTMLEGDLSFFLTIGNVAFLVVASHFLIKWRKDRESDPNRS